MENVIYDKAWFDQEPVIAALFNNQPSEKNNLDRTSDSSSYQDFVSLPYREDKFSNCNDIIFIDNSSLQSAGLFESPYFNVVDMLQIECMFFLNTGIPQETLEIYEEIEKQTPPNIQHVNDNDYIVETHAVQLYNEPIEIVRNSFPPKILYSDVDSEIIINPVDVRSRYTAVSGEIVLNVDEDEETLDTLSVSGPTAVSIYNTDTMSNYSFDENLLYHMFNANRLNAHDGILPWTMTPDSALYNVLVDLDILHLVGENVLVLKFTNTAIDINNVSTVTNHEFNMDEILYIHPNPITKLSDTGIIIFEDPDHLPLDSDGNVSQFEFTISHQVDNVQYIDRLTGLMRPMTPEQYDILHEMFDPQYDSVTNALDGEYTLTWRMSGTAEEYDLLNITMTERMTVQYSVKIEDDKGSYTYEIITVQIIPNLYDKVITTNLSIVFDGSNLMNQTSLDILRDAIVLIERKYHKMGAVNLNVIGFRDDDHISQCSAWGTDLSLIDINYVNSAVNIHSGLELLINTAFDGTEPAADQNVIYIFSAGDSDSAPVDYRARLYAYLPEWYSFVDSKIDKVYSYSINTIEAGTDITLVANGNEDKITMPVQNVTDIETLHNYVTLPQLWVKDIDYIYIDQYKVNRTPKLHPLFNYPGDGIKVSVYYSQKWYYETTRSRSKNLENLYEAVPGITLDVLSISSELGEDILYSDLNIICLPDDPFTDDEIEYMRRALIKGNRLFFIGEHGANEATVNGIINDTIIALGGNIKITNTELFDTLSKAVRTEADPVGFGNNINRSDLMAGVSYLDIGPVNQLIIDKRDTVVLVVDDADKILIAEQSVLNGKIVVMAGSHLDLHYGGEPYDNTQFMINMAIDSWRHNNYARDHIYLNDFTLNPYDDIFKGQFVVVTKIGNSDTTNIKMYNYIDTKQHFNMLYTDTYELFFNNTIYPFLSEVYFNREDNIGDYNLFKYMEDNGNSPNAFETWLYGYSPWKGITRDCSIRDQRLKVHTYINIVETLLIH